ncbi:MAG TPA: hypothetical protein VMH04_05540 [Candidatus Solibacter sp.]|nr:hypothetical protein [Candidatus Solibacter sp.]
MSLDQNQLPYSMAQLVEQAAARTGFSPAAMEDLLECELNTDHLLEYISAVVSNRMN